MELVSKCVANKLRLLAVVYIGKWRYYCTESGIAEFDGRLLAFYPCLAKFYYFGAGFVFAVYEHAILAFSTVYNCFEWIIDGFDYISGVFVSKNTLRAVCGDVCYCFDFYTGHIAFSEIFQDTSVTKRPDAAPFGVGLIFRVGNELLTQFNGHLGAHFKSLSALTCVPYVVNHGSSGVYLLQCAPTTLVNFNSKRAICCLSDFARFCKTEIIFEYQAACGVESAFSSRFWSVCGENEHNTVRSVTNVELARVYSLQNAYFDDSAIICSRIEWKQTKTDFCVENAVLVLDDVVGCVIIMLRPAANYLAAAVASAVVELLKCPSEAVIYVYSNAATAQWRQVESDYVGAILRVLDQVPYAHELYKLDYYRKIHLAYFLTREDARELTLAIALWIRSLDECELKAHASFLELFAETVVAQHNYEASRIVYARIAAMCPQTGVRILYFWSRHNSLAYYELGGVYETSNFFLIEAGTYFPYDGDVDL